MRLKMLSLIYCLKRIIDYWIPDCRTKYKFYNWISLLMFYFFEHATYKWKSPFVILFGVWEYNFFLQLEYLSTEIGPLENLLLEDFSAPLMGHVFAIVIAINRSACLFEHPFSTLTTTFVGVSTASVAPLQHFVKHTIQQRKESQVPLQIQYEKQSKARLW